MAVDFGRARPSFGRAQDDHGPARTSDLCCAARFLLNATDSVDGEFQRGSERLMQALAFGAFNKERLVAVTAKQLFELLVADPHEDRRVIDFVAVQMQYGEDGAVACRIQKLIGMPGSGERAGFSFAVARSEEHTS